MAKYSGVLFPEFSPHVIMVLKNYLFYLCIEVTITVAVYGFIEYITYLTIVHTPDLVFGNFNMNDLMKPPLLERIRHQGYKLLVNEPAYVMVGYLIMFILGTMQTISAMYDHSVILTMMYLY